MASENLQAAVKWLLDQRPEYGEAAVRVIFHDGQIRRIEKNLVERTQ